MTDVTTTKLWIPEGRLPRVNERYARAVKTAQRLGFEAPTLRLGERKLVEIQRSERAWYSAYETAAIPSHLGGEAVRQHLDRNHTRYFAWEVEVEVSGGIPRLNGWQILAAVDRSDGASAIVRGAPGAPEGLRSLIAEDGRCDHCESKRTRHTTYLVRNESGEIKNVGSGCLADFTGHLGCSPESILSYLHDASLANDDSEEDDYASEHASPLLDLPTFLCYSIASIDLHGWVSMSSASTSMTLCATATDVLYSFIVPPKAEYMGREQREELARMRARARAEKTQAEAAAIIAWAQSISTNASDYESNLRALATNGLVNVHKHRGLGCSMVVAYRRAHDLAISEHEARTQAPLLNEYGADVGEKILDRKLRIVKRVRSFQNEYGTTYLVTMEDEQRRTYQWWASHDPTSEDEYATDGARRERESAAWAQVAEEAKVKFEDPSTVDGGVYLAWATPRAREILNEIEEVTPRERRTSNRLRVWDVGEWMYLDGRVKKHDVYQGMKITTLTRCTWAPTPRPPKAPSKRKKKVGGASTAE